MNEYQRNTGMVICILAVLIGGAVVVGVLTYLGPSYWGWGPFDTVYYSFDETVGSTTGIVTLDVDLTGGTLNLEFDENATLLYRIDVATSNQTVQQEGAPTVGFTANRIALNYPAGAVNVTLGSGVAYKLEITAAGGSITCALTSGANVSDVAVETAGGFIDFSMTNDVVIIGSPDFTFETTLGAIEVDISLPDGVGGSVEGAAGWGSVNIDAPGWTEVTANRYESPDYDSATQIVTLTAQTDSGSIDIEVL
ncbi:MAG: hypothetical protein ACFFAY_01665 [Promethearchaeota archaeon]